MVSANQCFRIYVQYDVNVQYINIQYVQYINFLEPVLNRFYNQFYQYFTTSFILIFRKKSENWL